MSGQSVTLTAKGLSNIPQSKERNDFTFVVGDVCYSCAWYVAAFLSPRICALHKVDSTTNEFVVHTEDRNHEFEQFLSLGYGATLALTSANRSFFSGVSEELGNIELLLAIENVLDGDFQASNVVRRLHLMTSAGFEVCEAVEFAASHLSEIESSVVDTLSYEELELIVNHPSLRLESEDDLCEMIFRRLEEDLRYVGLFEYVHFEYISIGALDRFCMLISEHLDWLNVPIWSNIRRRLIHGISNDHPTVRRCAMVFRPVDSRPLDGIIAHLTRESRGNVHTQGIVKVTGHHCYGEGPAYAALNAADLTANSYFLSKHEPNQSLVYDFLDRRIRLSHYSIRSRHDGGSNDYYLRSWVIEISDGGETWAEVDRHEDDSRLKGEGLIHCFGINHETPECRLVRLRQIGQNHYSSPSHCLVMSGFELFGSLIQ
jgi:hypothetical protein